MNRPREIHTGALCLALLAAAFCFWSAAGNDLGLCVTGGCALYQDATVAGVSLWWVGSGVFLLLGLLALLGAAGLGRALSALALLADTALLLLMALTAPCSNCLVVAVFFALLYRSFRKTALSRARTSQGGRSLLLAAWLVLFLVNLGAVGRSQAGVWAMTDNEDAAVRVFFSPSCPSCRDAVAALSGHVDVAFCPLAENDADVQTTARMLRLLDDGTSMIDALLKARAESPQATASLHPDMLLLRFRMLRNKAHVLSTGSQTVPFLEYRGLPSMLAQKNREREERRAAPPAQPPAPAPGQPPAQPPEHEDAHLPVEPLTAGQCGGANPCP